MNDELKRELQEIKNKLDFDYSGLASAREYEIKREFNEKIKHLEYEFSNEIGRMKQEFQSQLDYLKSELYYHSDFIHKYNNLSDDDKLEKINIQVIEQFLRKKKILNLKDK